jgi:hypothetical protein
MRKPLPETNESCRTKHNTIHSIKHLAACYPALLSTNLTFTNAGKGPGTARCRCFCCWTLSNHPCSRRNTTAAADNMLSLPGIKGSANPEKMKGLVLTAGGIMGAFLL